jgi:large subunit ribosomal protein L13
VDSISYKTVSANKATAKKDWILIDAENEVLGRLASHVAKIVRGKNKPEFTPHADAGDNVVIINAEKIRLTGKKLTDKQYTRHTGYPGGQRFATPIELLAKKPESIIEFAIKGMLPKGPLGRALQRNVFIYAGSEHPHEAQQPKPLNINSLR